MFYDQADIYSYNYWQWWAPLAVDIDDGELADSEGEDIDEDNSQSPPSDDQDQADEGEENEVANFLLPQQSDSVRSQGNSNQLEATNPEDCFSMQ